MDWFLQYNNGKKGFTESNWCNLHELTNPIWLFPFLFHSKPPRILRSPTPPQISNKKSRKSQQLWNFQQRHRAQQSITFIMKKKHYFYHKNWPFVNLSWTTEWQVSKVMMGKSELKTFHSVPQLRETTQPQTQSHGNGTKLKGETKSLNKIKKFLQKGKPLKRQVGTWCEHGKVVDEGRKEAFHHTPYWHLHQRKLVLEL